MIDLRLSLTLFLIIFLEGYVVLSSELLAIRQVIPYAGSGTDTVSIIIAAVLMPLAFGYQAGGQFIQGWDGEKYVSIRKKLIFNLIVSQSILLFGLSYFVIDIFFTELFRSGITNRILQVTIYSLVFIVSPVYLLGQTIPLISNYFSKEQLSKITGKILFFSTLGSFMGAIFSTLVLMAIFGVHHTVSINFIILASLITLLNKDKQSRTVLLSWAITIFAMLMNSNIMMNSMGIVNNNQYNTVQIHHTENERHLFLNRNYSSMMDNDGNVHPYIAFMDQKAIMPIWKSAEKRNILVLGAGGFTIGAPDKNNHYDFVDIDPDLKDIAETYILEGRLSENKHFHPIPARAFLNKTDLLYDLIILDAYHGAANLPEHLATKEFFEHVKEKLKPGGVVMANFIASPTFGNDFSRNIHTTFTEVFPYSDREILGEYNLWSDNKSNTVNAVYTYKHNENEKTKKIYTDNHNTIYLDIPKQ